MMNSLSIQPKPEKKKSIQTNPYRGKILILDDDPIVTKVISQHLRVTFPHTDISVSNQPTALPGFNIYFIDNDFDGKHMAKSLIEEIRLCEPHSLVVALSSTLKMEDLQTLVNMGCNAVYNKRSPHESYEAKTVIERYLNILQERHNSKTKTGFMDLLKSMKSLLAQWNQRLGKQIDG